MKVDGDKLAAGLRKVTPFMKAESDSTLHSVFAESHGGTLQLTTTDGFRMAHLTMTEIDFPEGDFVLSGDGCKDFSTRHHNGEQLEVVQDTKGPGSIKIGTVTVPMIHAAYPDYRQILPAEFETIAVVETKLWIKAIRKNSDAHTVGVVISEKGCRLYFQGTGGETKASEEVPTQLISGPERKVAFQAEYLRRALTSCAPTATLKLSQNPRVLFEADGYWQLLAPKETFPHEMNLTSAELEAIKWADEALAAVRKGEVKGRVLIGGGKFYLEVADLPDTQVLSQEPVLVGEDNG